MGLTCGSLSCIVATVFFLVLAILILVTPTPKRSVVKTLCGGNASCCGEEGVHQQVSPVSVPHGNGMQATTTETYNADGSVAVKQMHTNPHGSRNVTTTRNHVSDLIP